MIVDTKHGQFECKDITRKERRALYKKVKTVGTQNDLSELHDLADEFAIIAFGDDKGIEKALGSLTPLWYWAKFLLSTSFFLQSW
jgi:purine nucleoside permease